MLWRMTILAEGIEPMAPKTTMPTSRPTSVSAQISCVFSQKNSSTAGYFLNRVRVGPKTLELHSRSQVFVHVAMSRTQQKFWIKTNKRKLNEEHFLFIKFSTVKPIILEF